MLPFGYTKISQFNYSINMDFTQKGERGKYWWENIGFKILKFSKPYDTNRLRKTFLQVVLFYQMLFEPFRH